MATRACPRLTNQALAGVADMQVVAGLPQPPRTHSAAATAIQHQGYPQWALGWCPRTGTGCRAQLGTHLRRQKPHSVLTIMESMETLTTGHFSAKSDSVGSLVWPWGQAELDFSLLRGGMALTLGRPRSECQSQTLPYWLNGLGAL